MPAPELTEDRFLAWFWLLADRPDHAAECLAAADRVKPKEFVASGRGEVWRVLSARYCEGKPMRLQDRELAAAVAAVAPQAALAAVFELADSLKRETPEKLGKLAKPLLAASRARGVVVYLTSMHRDVIAAAERGADPAEVLKLAERRTRTLLEGFDRIGESPTLTPQQIVEGELAGMDAPQPRGVRWPWPRFQRAIGGPIRPGHLYGVSGLPGSGKSTWLANLWARLTVAGTPTIALVNEDADEWRRRGWAAEAKVPQVVAEPQAWDESDARVIEDLRQEWRCDADAVREALRQYRPAYANVVEAFRELSWASVDQTDITPAEVLTKCAAIRRRWPGQHVVILLDHAHNLVFEQGKGDLFMGDFVRRLKAFLKADEDGGLSGVVLFQNRKPGSAQAPDAPFRPILASEVAGRVAPHLNAHVSLFRRRVVTHPHDSTPWGTPACRMEGGVPVFADRQAEEADGTHVDTQHIYLLADKRRTAGMHNTMKGFFLDIHAPSGRVFELDTWHSGDGR